MNKRSQFQLLRQDGKIILTDTAKNEYKLTAAQAERLGRSLVGEAKQMKRVRRLRKLVPIRLLGGEK